MSEYEEWKKAQQMDWKWLTNAVYFLFWTGLIMGVVYALAIPLLRGILQVVIDFEALIGGF